MEVETTEWGAQTPQIWGMTGDGLAVEKKRGINAVCHEIPIFGGFFLQLDLAKEMPRAFLCHIQAFCRFKDF